MKFIFYRFEHGAEIRLLDVQFLSSFPDRTTFYNFDKLFNLLYAHIVPPKYSDAVEAVKIDKNEQLLQANQVVHLLGRIAALWNRHFNSVYKDIIACPARLCNPKLYTNRLLLYLQHP